MRWRRVALLAVTSAIAVVAVAGSAGARNQRVTISFQRYWDAPCSCYKFRFFGTISNGAANEYVAVLQKQCGATFATAVAGALTMPGGAWETVPDGPTGGGEYRARWNDEVSESVTYRPPLVPYVEKLRPGRYRVLVYPYYVPPGKPQNMKGRTIQLQRLVAGQWSRIRTGKLAAGKTGASGTTYAAAFTVGKGLKLRAFLPAKSALPCFASAVSKTFRS